MASARVGRTRRGCGWIALAVLTLPCARAEPGWRRIFMHEEVERVTLAEFAAAHRLSVEDRGEAGLRLGGRRPVIAFSPDGRRATFRGTQMWLQAPLQRPHGHWAMARVDADTLLAPLLRPHRRLVHRHVRVVVLDPGHGGADSGAIGPNGLLEKDVVLDIARQTRTRLEAANLRVHLTREDDRFVELAERTRIAARLQADLFVSIHANGFEEPGVSGVETFVLSKAGFPSTNSAGARPSARYQAAPGNAHDEANTLLGFYLQRRLLQESRSRDRGLRHARFLVLKDAPCPAALVECGFLTHAQEAERLGDPAYRARLARAIALGILDVVNETHRARLLEWRPPCLDL